IGGGFIGSEIAAALAMNGKQVVMIFPENAIGARVYPPDLGLFLNRYYIEKGVEVLAGQSIAGLQRQGDRLTLQLRSDPTSTGESLEVDAVVAGIGIDPATQLAADAGLPVEDGIIVDESLRAGHP